MPWRRSSWWRWHWASAWPASPCTGATARRIRAKAAIRRRRASWCRACGDPPAAMDAGVALEIRRDGGGGDFLYRRELRHGGLVEPEASEVVREVQHPAGG